MPDRHRRALAVGLFLSATATASPALAQDDTTPPRVVSIAPDPGRWVTDDVGLAEIRVGFSEAVTVPTGAVEIRTLASGTVVGSTLAFDGQTNVLTITLPEAITQDRVTLVLDCTIADRAANALDGEIDDPASPALPTGDGIVGGHGVFCINVVQGDANRDGVTDVDDLLVMVNSMNQCIGDADFNPDCDLNLDGCSNALDVDLVQHGLGQMLPAADLEGVALIPGSGFTGPTTTPGPVGDASDPGYDATAIGRWDVVPWQTISDSFEVGVTAFHRSGIDRVEFSVDGGPWSSVPRMTVNPRTLVREYWARLHPATVSDGPVELRAVIYPIAGEPYVLPSMTLFANFRGTLPSEMLHVSSTGSDSAGDGTRDLPFRTLKRALNEVGSDLESFDGAEIVVLRAGEYDIDTPAAISNERWITIRAADGLDRDDVVLAAGGWELMRPKTRRFRFANVSLDFSRTMQMYKEDDHWQWYDRCRWFQSDGWDHAVSPYLQPVRNVDYNGLYVTGSLARDTLYGFVGCNLVRNSRVERISGDCFQNTLAVISCSAHQVDGTVLDHHSDLLQYFGDFEHLVVYGLKATDVTMTQNFFFGWNQTSFANCAFVNIVIQNEESELPFSQLHSKQKHVVFAHVTNPGQRWVLRDDLEPSKKFGADDVVFRNCVLDRLTRGNWGDPGVPEGVDVSHCHFLHGELHGQHPTTGIVAVEDGPGWTFELTGAGAPFLIDTGIAIPGLVTSDDENGPVLWAPDRTPWPAAADSDP